MTEGDIGERLADLRKEAAEQRLFLRGRNIDASGGSGGHFSCRRDKKEQGAESEAVLSSEEMKILWAVKPVSPGPLQ